MGRRRLALSTMSIPELFEPFVSFSPDSFSMHSYFTGNGEVSASLDKSISNVHYINNVYAGTGTR